MASQCALCWVTQGLAATMQYVEIVYAELWGVLIFDERPPWQSVCGAALVMCCAIVTLLKKREPPALKP